MPDTKISADPLVAPTLAAMFPFVEGGQNRRSTLSDMLAAIGYGGQTELVEADRLVTSSDIGKELIWQMGAPRTMTLQPAAALVGGAQPANTVPLGSALVVSNDSTQDLTVALQGSGYTVDGLTTFVMYPREVRSFFWLSPTVIYSRVIRSFIKAFSNSSTTTNLATTFTDPPGYSRGMRYDIRGPGAGGGGGCRQATGSTCSGGAGGSPGHRPERGVISLTAGTVRSIVIPIGGLGGVGATADSTAGGNGSAATADTTCTGIPSGYRGGAGSGGMLASASASGSSGAPTAVGANATSGSVPTTPSGATAGSTANGNGGQFTGGSGAGSGLGGAGSIGGHGNRAPAGGGSGGGLPAGETAQVGGAGGPVPGATVGGSTAVGATAANGVSAAETLGTGGAGGASAIGANNGGNGGNGGPGAGGGGGGSCRNGATPGNGGMGGPGYLILEGIM